MKPKNINDPFYKLQQAKDILNTSLSADRKKKILEKLQKKLISIKSIDLLNNLHEAKLVLRTGVSTLQKKKILEKLQKKTDQYRTTICRIKEMFDTEI